MSPQLPSISIVTCSYQQARFLDATIRSVLSQQYPKLEYIVIDGGSRDGSREIIEQHADALAYWVSEPDKGQTHALIKGFAHARGDVLSWLCSDDLLLPGALGKVARYFSEHPEVDVVFGDSIWIDAAGAPLRPKREMGFSRFVFLHDHNYLPQPSMFWRRRLYEEVGGLRPYFNIAMDNDLWERFSKRARIGHLPEYLSCMRFYPEQKTRAAGLRTRGRKEGELVAMRASAVARAPVLRPFAHAAARVMRVVHRAAAGGYTARVPRDLAKWLEAYATHER